MGGRAAWACKTLSTTTWKLTFTALNPILPASYLQAELAAATARPTTTTSTPVATPSSAAHSDSAPAADAAAPASPAIPPRSPVEHYYSLPIWQINAVPLFFACDRSTAKQFAAEAAQVAKQAIKGAKEEGKAKAKAKAKAPKQPAVA